MAVARRLKRALRHSSERRTHWNICRYNNFPDIHTLHAYPIVLNYNRTVVILSVKSELHE